MAVLPTEPGAALRLAGEATRPLNIPRPGPRHPGANTATGREAEAGPCRAAWAPAGKRLHLLSPGADAGFPRPGNPGKRAAERPGSPDVSSSLYIRG